MPTVDPTKTMHQWLTTRRWNRLHFVATVEHWGDEFFQAQDSQHDGARPFVAACGLVTRFVAPGVFSRMACPRCKRCCRRVGITLGNGAALNDKTCELVEGRP